MIPIGVKPQINMDVERRIFRKEAVLSSEQCQSLIDEHTSRLKEGINKYSSLFEIKFESTLLESDHTIHQALQTTWQEASDYLKIDIDFVEPYEIKRYQKDCFFGKHVDNYYNLDIDLDRKLTLVVQLTDSTYTGGELIIVNKAEASKSIGSVTVFPSFFSHEVRQVTQGERWSLIGFAWGKYWR